MQDVIADPTQEGAVLHQPELLGLAVQLGLMGPRAGDQKTGLGHGLDHLWHRLQGELKSLLIDQAADQQNELLIRGCELGPQADQLGWVLRLQVFGIDPVGNYRHPLLLDPKDVGDLLAHVMGAGDDRLAAIGDPALDPMNIGLRVLVTQPWWRPCSVA